MTLVTIMSLCSSYCHSQTFRVSE